MTWTIVKVILLVLGGTVFVTAGIFLSNWIADASVPSEWSWKKILAFVLWLAIFVESADIRTLLIRGTIITALGLLVMFYSFPRTKKEGAGSDAGSMDKKEKS
jgi:hypothetical protein